MDDSAAVRQRFFVPEIEQGLGIDAGQACLKSLLAGYDLPADEVRPGEGLRSNETGTSLDALEIAARAAGVALTRITLPPDVLTRHQFASLPAIVAVDLPDGRTRPIVLWRFHGPLIQTMDPSFGRTWTARRAIANTLHIDEHRAPVVEWEERLNSAEFALTLDTRMRSLGVEPCLWADRAQQDAALRLGCELREARKLRKGRDAQQFLDLCARYPQDIPRKYWWIWPDSAGQSVVVRGATLLVTNGFDERHFVAAGPSAQTAPPAEQAAASVWEPVWQTLRAGRWRLPAFIVAALCAAAFGTVIEALLFRGLFDMGRHLQSTMARLSAMGALCVFLVALLALDWPAARGMYRLGRQLETRLRTQFSLKIPRAGDRYFQTRRIADLAFRAHWLYSPRQLPEAVGYSSYLIMQVVITGLAIAWVYPGSSALVSVAVLAACGIPVLFFPAAAQRDLRYREHGAALGAFYLDSLLGSRAVQAHCAQQAIRTAHSNQLAKWAASGLRLQAIFVVAETLQTALSLACVFALVYRTALQQSPAGLLLLIFWSTSIPLLGREIAATVRSIPAMRSALTRFKEVISADENVPTRIASVPRDNSTPDNKSSAGVRIIFDDISIVSDGHPILDRISFHVEPGEHIAIVGESGAGKSSMVGCLLGWFEPTSGVIRIDDMPLGPEIIERLRAETAWIDPQVHLFRTSLFDNLRYGNGPTASAHLGDALECADLGVMLERMPLGLQSPLGEGGALISGGEGQRVRIGRALCRRTIRLAVLDEPARGLEHDQRRRVLAATRRRLAAATLLCVTHDVADTLDFDRVLVLESGRLVEQGTPRNLMATESRYRALLEADQSVNRDLWKHPSWRRYRLSGGTLHAIGASVEPKAMAEVRALREVHHSGDSRVKM
jgi:ATP-binding cassette subfamily B protein